MSKVALLSTYELGAQPLGLASVAALLRASGHEVRAHDLSIEDWPAADLLWADAIGCSVPMHTALRLGLDVLARLRAEQLVAPFAFYGLYAPVAAMTGVLGPNDLAAAKDLDTALLEWLETIVDTAKDRKTSIVRIATRRTKAAPAPMLVPDRRDLPALDSYAHLLHDGVESLVGSVESSIGCNHRCRHCPVPVVYRGRSSAVELSAVIADIDQLVDLGATHIHFADADFLNRPRHALRVARALHEAHPELSFDATIKVSHILRHATLFEELARCGLLFVISAFESTSDVVLEHLDKGHVAADEVSAIAILRAQGIEIRPSLLPFTPWTTRDDVIGLLDFVADNDLVANVDPVQYGVRLLIPPGSLLLAADEPVLAASITGYDPADLGYAWKSPDPVLDDLAGEIAVLAEKHANDESDIATTYLAIRALVHETFGVKRAPLVFDPVAMTAAAARPRLSEAWFCCSEPTQSQLAQISATRGSCEC